jgi:hypothetical protein
MEDGLKSNLKSKGTWKRGLYMLLFAVIYGVTEFVLTAVVLFQFGSQLITGRVNRRLLNFGQQLATYLYQIILFLTYKSEEMPYPFEIWPKGAPKKAPARRSSPSKASEESAPDSATS